MNTGVPSNHLNRSFADDSAVKLYSGNSADDLLPIKVSCIKTRGMLFYETSVRDLPDVKQN